MHKWRQKVKVQEVGRVRPSGAEHQERQCREAPGDRAAGVPKTTHSPLLPYETSLTKHVFKYKIRNITQQLQSIKLQIWGPSGHRTLGDWPTDQL